MKTYNLETYRKALKENRYRQEVVNIVAKWPRSKIELYLNNMSKDQLSGPLPTLSDMSLSDLRKLLCLVIWGWGWDGSVYFIKMFGDDPNYGEAFG